MKYQCKSNHRPVYRWLKCDSTAHLTRQCSSETDENEFAENTRSPITIMRNELISQGGSGVPIDRDAYMKSVEYWKVHAVVM